MTTAGYEHVFQPRNPVRRSFFAKTHVPMRILEIFGGAEVSWADDQDEKGVMHPMKVGDEIDAQKVLLAQGPAVKEGSEPEPYGVKVVFLE